MKSMNNILNFGRILKNQLKNMIIYKKRKMRIGFIGCGKHATINLYPALTYTDANLVSVCAKHYYSAINTSERFGAERHYLDYEKMMKEEKLDGVVICVNRKLHPKIITRAINNNLHVFVEKPPVSTVKELNDIVELAKLKKKEVMVGYQKRFSTIYTKLKEVIVNGELGKITSYKSEFYVGRHSSIEEMLYELGIHHIDLAQYLMGQIVSINYETKNSSPHSITLTLNFKNNVTGKLFISSSRKKCKDTEKIEVIGELNSAIAENMSKLTLRNKSVWELNPVVPSLENNTVYTNGYVPELKHFIESIENNKTPHNSLKDSIRTIEIIERICKFAGNKVSS